MSQTWRSKKPHVKGGLYHGSKKRGSKKVAAGILRWDSFLIILALVLASTLYNYYYEDQEPLQRHEVTSHAQGRALMKESEAVRSLPPLAQGEQPRFLLYNVENYFVAGERTRSSYPSRPKSERSREAVAEVIARSQADIVGLIEIGGQKALLDLRARLEKRGKDYPYYRVLERQGEDRAVAILSRYPIIADDSRAQYPLHGTHRRMMLRGLLDVTVQLSKEEKLRLIGAHLKSRVADDQAKARALRTNEAATIALHLVEIAKKQAHMPLLVFGDWNDPPLSPSIAVLEQGKSKKSALTRILAKDSRGEEWTIYYRKGRSYYTFDHIYINEVLKKRRSKGARSGVLDGAFVEKASDHRPVWMDL